jgi:5'-phosphate synthase pdxT subunit
VTMDSLVAETTLGSLEGKAEWAGLTVGVLALQGAFAEHAVMFRRLGVGTVKEVRTAAEMEGCDGLAIPGGESTAMVLIAKPGGHGGGDKVQQVAKESGILDAITSWVQEKKMPTWGTCAGLILLSNELASGTTKQGGQGVVGGLSVCSSRNFFGRQLASFEANLEAPCLGEEPYRGVFIRAPAILEVSEGCESLCKMTYQRPDQPEPEEVHVAVKQDHLLGCAFHPELTNDPRFHGYFLDMCAKAKADRG